MNHIKNNTILGQSLFSDKIQESYILHIPHSQVNIPDYTGYDISKIDSETKKLVDISTDKIFNIDGLTKIIFPYNRIFCDVERLEDFDEPMFQYGRGFFYTKTDSGEFLRSEDNKDYVYNIYKQHHKDFEKLVEEKLESLGYVTIIDCHSFSDVPFISDIDKSPNRPDICIGVDSFHTPNNLLQMFKSGFEREGFSVEINRPYNGTIVPLKYYNVDENVHSIMIEINRKLFMSGDDVLQENAIMLNDIIKKIIGYL